MSDAAIRNLVRRAFLPYAAGFLHEPNRAMLTFVFGDDGRVFVTLWLGSNDFDMVDSSQTLQWALAEALSNLTLIVDGRDGFLDFDELWMS